MKKSITIRAQTVEEAIRLALEHLDRQREEVDVRVLEEPGEGGVIIEEALVQVTVRGAAPTETDAPAPAPAPAPPPAPEEVSDPAELGREILTEILWRMGIQAEVTVDSYSLVPGEEQSIIEVTHDPRAAAYADRVVFLRDGKILREILLEKNLPFQVRLRKINNILEILEQ